MLERFTNKARRVVVLAQEEARMLNHNSIGTEHILLGLICHGVGAAAQVLVKQGAELNRVRQQVIQLSDGDRGTEPADAPTAVPERGKRLLTARVHAIGSRLSAARQRVSTRPRTSGPGQRPPATVPVTLVGVRVA